MINSNVFDYINVMDKAADASWTRNEIIANNIANIDTPGYKRQDLNFESELERALGHSRYKTMDAKVSDLKISYTEEWTDVFVYFEGGSDNIYIDDFTLKTAPVYHPQSDIPSLKDVYADSFKIGTACTSKELAPASTKELILKHFNSITPGNEMKPDALLDQKACLALAEAGDDENPQVSLASASSILNFARDNNIPVRGHVLIWHQQTPTWFFKENYDAEGEWVSKEKMLIRMENYIKNVFAAVKKEYPDVEFYAWDVVNECLLDDGSARQPGSQEEGSSKSPWVKVFGDNSFIKPAFEFAKKYAPEGCKLYYNDFNEYMPGKREAIVALTEEINADGHFIDGIGMQSHLGTDVFPTANVYEKALSMFAATGLDIQITELDQMISSTDKFEEQAKYYSDIMDVIMKYQDSVSAVVFWGTTDDMSWRASKYPLLFNEDYTAKPCFYSIVDGFEGTTEPVTSVQGDVNADGEFNISDVVLFQKWLLAVPNTKLNNWKAADLCSDNRLDVFDLVLMKRELIDSNKIIEQSAENGTLISPKA